MKKLLTTLAAFTAMLLSAAVLLPGQARAVDILSNTCAANPAAAVCQDNQTATGEEDSPLFGPNGIVTIAARLLSFAVGAASVVIIIISGVKFTNSHGDANAATSSRNTLIYACGGLVIALLAQVLAKFILAKV